MTFRGMIARWHLEYYDRYSKTWKHHSFYIDGTWESAIERCAKATRVIAKWRVSPVAVLLDS